MVNQSIDRQKGELYAVISLDSRWSVGSLSGGKAMGSEGQDVVMDLVMGLAGAVAGGFRVSVMGLPVQGTMIFTDPAAIAGGVILTVLTRIARGAWLSSPRVLGTPIEEETNCSKSAGTHG